MHTIRIAEIEADLPDCMNSLSQEEVNSTSVLKDCGERIVSCGVIDGHLHILTGRGDVKMIMSNGFLLPKNAFPSDDGMFILVQFTTKREEILSSKSVVSNSISCLNKSQLFVNNNYTCELELEKFTCLKE
jgi:hypothetical protein